MLNGRLESVNPVVFTRAFDKKPTWAFIVHDSQAWLIYPNKGVKLLEQLDIANIKYTTYTHLYSTRYVAVEPIVYSAIHQFMVLGGYADLELCEYLKEVLHGSKEM